MENIQDFRKNQAMLKNSITQTTQSTIPNTTTKEGMAIYKQDGVGKWKNELV